MEFMVYSFAGWVYETALGWLVYQEWQDRGALRLPVCPIYGFGGMLLLLLFRRKCSGLTVFAVSAVLTTLLELACSYLLDMIGRPQLWSYEGWLLEFEGRISLPSSLIFGAMSVIMVKLAHPLLERLCGKLPVWAVGILGIVPVLGMLTDAVLLYGEY